MPKNLEEELKRQRIEVEAYQSPEDDTFQYLWTVEALKWFVAQLDGGKVLPYVEPNPPKPK